MAMRPRLGSVLGRAVLGLAILAAAAPAAAFDLEFVAASPQLYAKPHDLVLAPDGRRLYVADNDNDRIAVLDPETLELLGVFGEDEVSAPPTMSSSTPPAGCWWRTRATAVSRSTT